MAILILCSDWWSDYRGKGIWGNSRGDYRNTSILDGNLRTFVIKWGAARVKKKVTTWWAPHDTQLVCKLEASLLFFSHRCLWRLTWILKNQVMLLLLSPHFLPWLLWEEPWRCMLFQGCGQLLGQQLSTSSRVLLFGKRVLCSLLAAQGAIEVFF